VPVGCACSYAGGDANIMQDIICDPSVQQQQVHDCTHLRMILLRSFATILLHSGQADVASATAAEVSFAFMQGTAAMTSPVAGFVTCNQHNTCG